MCSVTRIFPFANFTMDNVTIPVYMFRPDTNISENDLYSANDMFSWYKYLIVNLVFSHLGFWSGNFF